MKSKYQSILLYIEFECYGRQFKYRNIIEQYGEIYL